MDMATSDDSKKSLVDIEGMAEIRARMVAFDEQREKVGVI